jgi:hypothetical protein
VDHTTAEYNSYLSDLSAYNTLRTAYNDANTIYKAQQADWYKNTFESPVAVPTRPCAVSQPVAWTGPVIDWWVTDNLIANVNATGKANMYGVLDRLALTKPSLNSGFLAPTPDSTATPPVPLNAGHVFGLWGQGEPTMP